VAIQRPHWGKGGLNLYGFVSNGPINALDPSGEFTLIELNAIIAAQAQALMLTPALGIGPGYGVPGLPSGIPEQHPAPQYPQGFSVCQRDLQKDNSCDCPTMIGNALGGEHSYVQYFSQPESGLPYLWGWGFSKGGLAAETHFNPNSCTSCQKSSRSLKYGSAAGRPAKSVTDGDIQDCVKNSKPSQGYSTFKYNCRDWAKEAAKNCGLDCN
jgi:hypothetical protein